MQRSSGTRRFDMVPKVRGSWRIQRGRNSWTVRKMPPGSDGLRQSGRPIRTADRLVTVLEREAPFNTDHTYWWLVRLLLAMKGDSDQPGVEFARFSARPRTSRAVHRIACFGCMSPLSLEDFGEIDASFEDRHEVGAVHEDQGGLTT